MCIRDSFGAGTPRVSDGSMLFVQHLIDKLERPEKGGGRAAIILSGSPLFTGNAGCLLYTSDAADERSSVDLGGRRIIKKKKKPDTIRIEYSAHEHTTTKQPISTAE